MLVTLGNQIRRVLCFTGHAVLGAAEPGDREGVEQFGPGTSWRNSAMVAVDTTTVRPDRTAWRIAGTREVSDFPLRCPPARREFRRYRWRARPPPPWSAERRHSAPPSAAT